MQREQTTVRRIEVTRRAPVLVPCAYGAPTERMHNRYGSCGALIPMRAPGTPCPDCGQPQVKPHAPDPPDGARIIDGSAALVDSTTGEVVAAQVVAATHLADRLGAELRRMHWDAPVNARDRPSNEGRLSGIVVTHRTFGYVRPQPLRRRYACARSRLDLDYPAVSAMLGEFCRVAEHVFRTQATDVYDTTARAVRELIDPQWLIEGTPWTSGIINNTAALPYHRDANNVPRSWSAMLAARRNVGGGLLHLVDYDVWLTVPNGSISVFDGQSVVHGVTPLRPGGPNPYRFTVVTYALAGMRACCGTPADEVRRAALAATEATTRRRG